MTDIPTSNAVLAHVADSADVDAIRVGLSELGFAEDQMITGNGKELAESLARTDDTSSADSMLPSWLFSLGQDREVEVELAEQIREGRHAVIISGVDESSQDAVVDMLQQNGGKGINVLGKWQNEEVL